jgi:hypothetical protein
MAPIPFPRFRSDKCVFTEITKTRWKGSEPE